MDYQQPLLKYPHSNNSLLSSSNVKKSTAYEPRTEAISPAMNDDLFNVEDSNTKSTKDEQTLIVEKLKRVESEIVQTDLQIARLRRQKEQLEQAQAVPRHEDDQENVPDTRQLSIAKLVYHENRIKAQKSHARLERLGISTDLPIYNQPSDNVVYHQNAAKFSHEFKNSLIVCLRSRFQIRLKLEDSVSKEYDQRMESWLRSIELEDSQQSKRKEDAKMRDLFEKQFPEIKRARESGEKLYRVGQRVARSDAEVADLVNGIMRKEDQDRKVKSYAVIPPMLEEMRSKKPKYINTNGYVEDIVAEYKEYQIQHTWTEDEKDIFEKSYLKDPKNFALISRMMGRKSIPECVEYYYLSKKGKNYKEKLKKQNAKRRTRSVNGPKAATPANTELNEAERSISLGQNPNADSVINESGDPSTGSKSGASAEQLDVKRETCNMDSSDESKDTCCICKCDFSDNNQYRNVTRSNHQLYGISLEYFRPGMKICYPCRFRHVKLSNFDDPTIDPIDQVPSALLLGNDPTGMDVDLSHDTRDQIETLSTHMIGGGTNVTEKISAGCTASNCPPSEMPSDATNTNANDNTKVNCSTTVAPDGGSSKEPQQRTLVRDIIYQAIEMSFQKPVENLNETQSAPSDQDVKTEVASFSPNISQSIASNPPNSKPMGPSNPPVLSNPPTHQPGAQNFNLNQHHQMHFEMQQQQRKQLVEINNRQHQLQAQLHQAQYQNLPWPSSQPLLNPHLVPSSQPPTAEPQLQHPAPLLPPQSGGHHHSLSQMNPDFHNHPQLLPVHQQPSPPTQPTFIPDVSQMRHNLPSQPISMMNQQSHPGIAPHMMNPHLSQSALNLQPVMSQSHQPFSHNINGLAPRLGMYPKVCEPTITGHSPPQSTPSSGSKPNPADPQTAAKHSVKSPPMAHGDQEVGVSCNVDDGVLNLSIKSTEKPKLTEVKANVTPSSHIRPITSTVDTTIPAVVQQPAAPERSSKLMTPTSAQAPAPLQAAIKTEVPEQPTTIESATSATTTTAAAITTTITTIAAAAPASVAPAPSVQSPVAPKLSVVKEELTREDSESPREMVIDESAERLSPVSNSPKSNEQTTANDNNDPEESEKKFSVSKEQSQSS